MTPTLCEKAGSRLFLFLVRLLLLVPVLTAQTKEDALFAKIAEQTRRQTHPLSNAAVQDYVTQIGDILARYIAPPRKFNYNLITDDSGGKKHAPLALPNGDLFIPARLIADCGDELEFASKLAHAMALARAGLIKSVVNYGTIPLIFVGGWAEPTLLPRAMQRQQQEREAEASQEADRILEAARAELTDHGFASIRTEVTTMLSESDPFHRNRPPTLKRPDELQH